MIGALLREAAATARSQPVASVITMLMVAGMIVTVLLTTGRTVAAEQAVLESIDSQGTRSIVVRAESGAGVTSDVLQRVRNVGGIEWAGAFTPAVDATNALVTDGTRVPVRLIYTDDLSSFGIPADSPVPGGLAWASASALEQLGLADESGGIALTNGRSYAVAGQAVVPEFLRSFEPLVIVPQPEADAAEVSIVVVIAATPELVSPVSAAVLSVLAADDPMRVTVQTSEALASLRGLIEGQLGTFSRGLVLALLALTGTLVAILLYGLVMMRRKDFGRRRALGATRSLIVGLLLTQTAVLAAAGVLLGVIIAFAVLLASADPLPGIAFTTALGILGILTTLIAALVQDLVASRREPIHELRVP